VTTFEPARYEPDIAAMRADVEQLCAISRASARAGERASAAWLEHRLRELGLEHVRVERYRHQRTYALAHGCTTPPAPSPQRSAGAPAP